MKYLAIILVGYLLGSMSPAALIAKLKNKNLREHGTGNLGATNTMLNFGKLYGAESDRQLDKLLADTGRHFCSGTVAERQINDDKAESGKTAEGIFLFKQNGFCPLTCGSECSCDTCDTAAHNGNVIVTDLL